MGDETNWWSGILQNIGFNGDNSTSSVPGAIPWGLDSTAFDAGQFDDNFVGGTESLNTISQNLPQAQDPSGGFGTMQGWGQLLGGVGNIGKAYMAYKNYGLSRDQFDFSKQYANRNLENQTAVINAQLRSQNRARNRAGGGDRHTTQLRTGPIG